MFKSSLPRDAVAEDARLPPLPVFGVICPIVGIELRSLSKGSSLCTLPGRNRGEEGEGKDENEGKGEGTA